MIFNINDQTGNTVLTVINACELRKDTGLIMIKLKSNHSLYLHIDHFKLFEIKEYLL